ncbi:MAG: hypothetical protein HOO86_05365 [Bacteroidales bacterium]|nr:hypothetical protein [Bacteroidales bacterium]
MERIKINKTVNPTLEYIDNFGRRKKINIDLSDANIKQIEIDLWKQENEMAFEMTDSLDGTFHEVASYLDKIFDNNTITSGDLSFSFLSRALGNLRFNAGEGKIKGSLRSLIESKKNNYDGKFLRMVQPFAKTPKIGTFSGAVDLETDQKVKYGVGIINIQIKGKRLDIFRVSVEKEKYCFIDSVEKIDLDLFDKICSTFFYAYSYLFGYNVGKEAYILTSLQPDFESIENAMFYSKSPSSEHDFKIFDSMEIRSLGISSEFYQFPSITLSTLCEKLFSDEKYLKLINLINEANLNNYYYSSCVLFSVALETISGLIISSSNPQPIDPTRFEASNILSQLRQTIEENDTLNRTDKNFLIEKKIMSINKPTNADKITSPFEHLNISLPDPFKKALKYRDKYLHGSSPKNTTEKTGDYEDFVRKFELQFVVNVLTLKFAGYSGYLRNAKAIIELYSQIEKGIKKNEVKLSTSLYYKI